MTASFFAAAVLALVTARALIRSRRPRAVVKIDRALPARLRRAASPVDPRRRAA